MTSQAPLTYDQAGVNYDLIDPLKVTAQRAAAATASHLAGHGFTGRLENGRIALSGGDVFYGSVA